MLFETEVIGGPRVALPLLIASAIPSTAPISPLEKSTDCSGGGSASNQESRGKGSRAAS